MTDGDRDKMLREMAANRGCKLLKSRRRKPGGDFGLYGLKDGKTGREVFGFGEEGLTASAQDIESYLRGSTVATWKRSLIAAVDDAGAEPPKRSKVAARKKAAAPPPPPPPRPSSKREPKPREAEPAPAEPPPLSVREARPDDAAAIAALLAAIGSAASAADITASLKLLKGRGEPPLVAEQGEVVGCAAWHAAAELQEPELVGRIPVVVVAPEARKRGIGKALIEAAEARLAERGCGRVEVAADLRRSGALAFYQALGFERTGFRLARTIRG